MVAKFSEHMPLYRQSHVLARHGVTVDRSTLADWMGVAAWHLRPIVDRMAELLKQSGKLYMDETTIPVLDPGRGKTKTGYLWAMARDDRPWGGADPPGVVFTYAPGRAGAHDERLLTGFDGVLQVDGYAGYKRLTKDGRTAALGGHVALPKRMQGEDVTVAARAFPGDLGLRRLVPPGNPAEAPDQGVELALLHSVDAPEVGDDAQPGLSGIVAEGLDDLQIATPAALGDACKHGMQDASDAPASQCMLGQRRVTTRVGPKSTPHGYQALEFPNTARTG